MIGRYLHHARLILIAAVVPTAILYAIAISLELCGYSGHCDAASMAVIICLPPMILTFAVVFRVPRSSQYWLPIALTGSMIRAGFVLIAAIMMVSPGLSESIGMNRRNLQETLLWLATAYCLYLAWEMILHLHCEPQA